MLEQSPAQAARLGGALLFHDDFPSAQNLLTTNKKHDMCVIDTKWFVRFDAPGNSKDLTCDAATVVASSIFSHSVKNSFNAARQPIRRAAGRAQLLDDARKLRFDWFGIALHEDGSSGSRDTILGALGHKLEPIAHHVRVASLARSAE